MVAPGGREGERGRAGGLPASAAAPAGVVAGDARDAARPCRPQSLLEGAFPNNIATPRVFNRSNSGWQSWTSAGREAPRGSRRPFSCRSLLSPLSAAWVTWVQGPILAPLPPPGTASSLLPARRPPCSLGPKRGLGRVGADPEETAPRGQLRAFRLYCIFKKIFITGDKVEKNDDLTSSRSVSGSSVRRTSSFGRATCCSPGGTPS